MYSFEAFTSAISNTAFSFNQQISSSHSQLNPQPHFTIYNAHVCPGTKTTFGLSPKFQFFFINKHIPWHGYINYQSSSCYIFTSCNRFTCSFFATVSELCLYHFPQLCVSNFIIVSGSLSLSLIRDNVYTPFVQVSHSHYLYGLWFPYQCHTINTINNGSVNNVGCY